MPDFDWVTARLAIGGAVESLYDAKKIAAAGVTHVLNLRAGDKNPEHVTDEAPWWAQAGVTYKNLPEHDDGEPKPTEWYREGIEFVMGALVTCPAHRVLIHCKEGEHRSPSMAYAVLRAWGDFAKDAAAEIEGARKGADVGEYQADADAALAELGYPKK